jgi:transcriptional regulator with XRE-family HTH domain
MKNNELAQKIKILRNKSNLSQEELAEATGLSLRTIQRIENGQTNPRGESLKRLASVFDVSPHEISDWTFKEDKGFLISFNLSALSFLIFQLLGILVPLIIWIPKKDKIQNLNKIATDLLNFQITWTMLLFVGYISVIIPAFISFDIFGNVKNTSSFSSSPGEIFAIVMLIVFPVIMYLYNVISIIINSLRINKGKCIGYYPKIGFLRK